MDKIRIRRAARAAAGGPGRFSRRGGALRAGGAMLLLAGTLAGCQAIQEDPEAALRAAIQEHLRTDFAAGAALWFGRPLSFEDGIDVRFVGRQSDAIDGLPEAARSLLEGPGQPVATLPAWRIPLTRVPTEDGGRALIALRGAGGTVTFTQASDRRFAYTVDYPDSLSLVVGEQRVGDVAVEDSTIEARWHRPGGYYEAVTADLRAGELSLGERTVRLGAARILTELTTRRGEDGQRLDYERTTRVEGLLFTLGNRANGRITDVTFSQSATDFRQSAFQRLLGSLGNPGDIFAENGALTPEAAGDLSRAIEAASFDGVALQTGLSLEDIELVSQALGRLVVDTMGAEGSLRLQAGEGSASAGTPADQFAGLDLKGRLTGLDWREQEQLFPLQPRSITIDIAVNEVPAKGLATTFLGVIAEDEAGVDEAGADEGSGAADPSLGDVFDAARPQLVALIDQTPLRLRLREVTVETPASTASVTGALNIAPDAPYGVTGEAVVTVSGMDQGIERLRRMEGDQRRLVALAVILRGIGRSSEDSQGRPARRYSVLFAPNGDVAVNGIPLTRLLP